MIYFDNASTTAVKQEVIDCVCNELKESFANPSALHGLGFSVEKKITTARKKIADLLKVSADEIYFTSGGTEANNTAVLGVADAYKGRGNRVITTSIEHPSVADSFRKLESMGFDVVVLGVDEKGHISLEELENALNDKTILVSIMYVNNEVGSVQNMEEISKLVRAKSKAVLHTDCVQAFGKHNIPVKAVDMISISGHKINAPKGIGALYVKKGVRFSNLHLGGGQEKGLRPGTENTASIIGFALAAEIAYKNMQKNYENCTAVKTELLKITDKLENVWVNGDENGSAYILNLSFEGVKGEVLLHSLENDGIYVATGSACSSRVKEKKKIADMLIDGRGGSAVRFSFGGDNTVDEAKKVVEVLEKTVPLLRRFQPR
jgi:cysteine desulfurase